MRLKVLKVETKKQNHERCTQAAEERFQQTTHTVAGTHSSDTSRQTEPPTARYRIATCSHTIPLPSHADCDTSAVESLALGALRRTPHPSPLGDASVLLPPSLPSARSDRPTPTTMQPMCQDNTRSVLSGRLFCASQAVFCALRPSLVRSQAVSCLSHIPSPPLESANARSVSWAVFIRCSSLRCEHRREHQRAPRAP